MTLLTVTGISKDGENNFVLKDINFSQQKLKKIAIAGETGAGKSTLLKIIAGLIQPYAGEVLFKLERVEGPQEKLVPGHAGVCYLSQHFELPKFLRVEQILSYANTLSDKSAAMLYEVCEIGHLLKRKTAQLSGGEKQRIALAKLLITSPKLLLLDEPFSHLDMVHKNTLKTVIKNICKRLKITCILVSHDPLDTLSWADEIIVMKEGRIVQQGSPEMIYRQPINEYVAGLFGKYNLLSLKQAKGFSRLHKLKANGRNILVRPEHFKLVPDKRKGVKGKIHTVNFFGSYYESEVDVSDDVIIVKTSAPVSVGEVLNVAIDLKGVWYIN